MACRWRTGTGPLQATAALLNPMHSAELRASSQGPPATGVGCPPACRRQPRSPARCATAAAAAKRHFPPLACHLQALRLPRPIPSQASQMGIMCCHCPPAPASCPTCPSSRPPPAPPSASASWPLSVSERVRSHTHVLPRAAGAAKNPSGRTERSRTHTFWHQSRTTGAAGTPRQRPGTQQAHHNCTATAAAAAAHSLRWLHAVHAMLCHAAAVVSCPRRRGRPRVHCIHVLLLLLCRLQNLHRGGEQARQASGQDRRSQKLLRAVALSRQSGITATSATQASKSLFRFSDRPLTDYNVTYIYSGFPRPRFRWPGNAAASALAPPKASPPCFNHLPKYGHHTHAPGRST
jgi:hypothetical protein